VTLMVNEDILWLHVSIRDLKLMHVLKSGEDLYSVEESYIINKSLLRSQQSVQLSSTYILEEEEDVSFILECSFERDDEWMVEHGQNLLFIFQMLHLSQSNYFTFLQHFERVWSMGFILLLDYSYSTKGTYSNCVEELEIV
jgi:hypothetical protein